MCHFSTTLYQSLSDTSHNISRYIESELIDLRYFLSGKHKSGVIYNMGDELYVVAKTEFCMVEMMKSPKLGVWKWRNVKYVEIE
jgi:hypothetical protein